MEIRVYNWEHFERTKARFVAFAVSLAVIIWASIFFANLFGSIILFLFTWAYILFSLTKHKHINLWIRDSWLAVDARLRPWQSLDSFVVEVDWQTQEWKNIIIIMKNNDHMIFSFDDEHEKKKDFITELQTYISLVENYPQTTMDKMVRKMQL
jgi:hypothetical protein